MASVCFGFFGLEIILSSFAKEGYFLGFFFYLDLISTGSIIFDIQWITETLFSSGGAQSAQNAATLARASRASRIGTRAGRIIRIVRLIRLVKLYKHAQQTLLDRNNLPFKEELEEEDEKKNATVVERRESKLHQNANSSSDKNKKENTLNQVRNESNSEKKKENTFNADPKSNSDEAKTNKPEGLGEKIHKQVTIENANKENRSGENISKSKEINEKSSSKIQNSSGAKEGNVFF